MSRIDLVVNGKTVRRVPYSPEAEVARTAEEETATVVKPVARPAVTADALFAVLKAKGLLTDQDLK